MEKCPAFFTDISFLELAMSEICDGGKQVIGCLVRMTVLPSPNPKSA